MLKKTLGALLVTALVAPLLVLSGCCKDNGSYCDKMGTDYSTSK